MEATISRRKAPTKIHRSPSPIGVLDVQRGGQLKDLAAVQRGGELQKLWTNFYSFFNTSQSTRVQPSIIRGVLCVAVAPGWLSCRASVYVQRGRHALDSVRDPVMPDPDRACLSFGSALHSVAPHSRRLLRGAWDFVFFAA